MSLSAESSKVKDSITTFVDNSNVGDAFALDLDRLDTAKLNHLGGSENIVKFLERPVQLTSGLFSTVDSGTLYSVDPFIAIIADTYKAKKLDGVFLLRANVKVRLQVNATRFQTGRYILYFHPSFGGVTTYDHYLVEHRIHCAHLTQLTQMPHVELDLGTQSYVEMVLPFNAVYNHFPLQTPAGQYSSGFGFGNIYLIPYAALDATEDLTCGYSIYASLCDIELSAPTITQDAIVCQDGSAQDQEQAGFVESALTKVSKVSGVLGEFPLLAPFTRTVGWASDILARAAHIFGWSKPLNIAEPTLVYQRCVPNIENVDGCANARSLALTKNNQVVSNVSGRTADEMSFDFVKTIWAYTGTFTWHGTDAAGTALLHLPVVPVARFAYGKGEVETPLSFLCRFFRHWRGGIKYRFKFVKNEFFSGRVAFSFQPLIEGGTNAGTYPPTEQLHRQIVDLRTIKEFEFTVPWTSPFLYERVESKIGYLLITVVDQLIAPSSSPQDIRVLIEVCGAPDFEVAGFVQNKYDVYCPYSVQDGSDDSVVVQYNRSPPSVLPASIGPGEKIESLRQLAKVASHFYWTGSTTSTGKTFSWSPYYRAYVHQITSNSTTLTRDSGAHSDLFTVVTAPFGHDTGNLRTILYSAKGGVTLDQFVQMGYDNDFDCFAASGMFSLTAFSAPAFFSKMRAALYTLTEGLLDVIVPNYNRHLGRPISGSYASSQTGWLTGAFTQTPAIVVQNPNTTTYEFPSATMRMGADDYNASVWLSTPCLVEWTTT